MAVGKGSIIRASNAAAKADKIKELQQETVHSQTISITTNIPIRHLQTVPKGWGISSNSGKEFDILAQSIENYGILEPLIVWNKEERQFVVLDGYKRLNAIRKLRFEEAPVYILEIPTEKLAREIYGELHRFTLKKQTVKSYEVVSSIRSDVPPYLL